MRMGVRIDKPFHQMMVELSKTAFIDDGNAKFNEG